MVNSDYEKNVEIFRKNQLAKIDRIRIFGKSVLPALKEKLSSLDSEINDKNDRIQTKELMLEKASILSLVEIDGENSGADIPLIHLKDTEKWFGNEIINQLFRADVNQLNRERKNILSAIRIIEGRNISTNILAKITDQDIETARTFPLIEVAEAYVKLKRSGSSKYTGSCPLHDDRTPSFVVYEESNRFKCFGCQASGNVIGFLMKVKNLSFTKAVKVLVRLQQPDAD